MGGGGFAPFLHDAVLQMEPGEEKEVTVPPKDAFGECESDHRKRRYTYTRHYEVRRICCLGVGLGWCAWLVHATRTPF